MKSQGFIFVPFGSRSFPRDPLVSSAVMGQCSVTGTSLGSRRVPFTLMIILCLTPSPGNAHGIGPRGKWLTPKTWPFYLWNMTHMICLLARHVPILMQRTFLTRRGWLLRLHQGESPEKGFVFRIFRDGVHPLRRCEIRQGIRKDQKQKGPFRMEDRHAAHMCDLTSV